MESVEVSSQDLMARCKDEEGDLSTKRSIFRNYIIQTEIAANHFSMSRTSKLFGGATWVNCEENLNYSNLCDRLVLLDFFTYCCINCIHIMPFLHHLESKYPIQSGLVVIGVHSAKFPNEKLEDNIKNAISRYDLQHPVVNDSDIEIWDEFSVKCWPTLVLISPTGKVLFSIPGESHSAMVELFIDVAMEYYQSEYKLKKEPIGMAPMSLNSNKDGLAQSLQLKYPGKVALDQSEGRIAISDSGSHRIIISDNSGNVLHIIGKPTFGFVDGSFEEARFNSPQGLTWHGRNAIFVADCYNHAVRKIDLLVQKVITVCGTGVQGSDLEGGKHGLEQEISSPWDVQVGGSPKFPDAKNMLYIAMSGCHQIWALFLKTADYQKGAELEMGTCIRYAGNGNEENKNNSYPHKAGFAQPSGLTVDEIGHSLYVADSESSTIRKIRLTDGAVQAVVGGDIDPTNLFAFGDVDGKGRDAKLQHPIGVVWDHKRSVMYVADTYNHKIKVVDPKSKTCNTLELGGSVLNEPSGLALDRNCNNLFIADTNNHDIKVLSLEDKILSKIILKMELKLETLSMEETDGPKRSDFKLLTGNKTPLKTLDQLNIHRHQSVKITLKHGGYILSADAPSSWQVSCRSTSPEDEYKNSLFCIASGKYSIDASQSTVSITHSMLTRCCGSEENVSFDILIESVLYYCLKSSDVCVMRSYKASLPVKVIQSDQNGNVEPIDVCIEV